MPIKRRAKVWLLGLLAGVMAGCPLDGLIPTEPGELTDLFSSLALRPYATCEELRDGLGLEYLIPVNTPAEAGLAYGEFWVPAEDGSLLRVWHMPSSLNRGVVVISNGAAGQMQCGLFWARMLVHNGWSVVMFDYRGFGLSGGVPSVAHLAPDLLTVLEWTRTALATPRVTIMGVSIGSIPAIAAATTRPEWVNAVVLDSPLALGEWVRNLDALLGDSADLILATLSSELFAEQQIRYLEAPLLVFASGQDYVTPPSTVQKLFDNAPVFKQIVFFEDLDHIAGAYYESSDYIFHLDQFLALFWPPNGFEDTP